MMDHEQFGGRTDDDLFSDDIEPVEEVITLSVPDQAPSHGVSPEPEAAPAAPQPAPTTAHQPPKSLAQSRHAPSPRPDKAPRPPRNNNKKSKPSSDHPPSEPASASESRAGDPSDAATKKPPPNAPREPSSTRNATATTAATTATTARLNSGANPRTKLTEEELAARMEKMRLLAAEKTRRFEEAQRDESEHAAALAKGLEEARRRKAQEAERRKAAEEERRKLEEERARNRERKLKAMGAKEGGWDIGKEGPQDDDGGRGAFRGAHGGVRGTRASRGGLGGSRFAVPGEGVELDDGGLPGGGRGNGRGRGGRGRGGRGGSRPLFDAHGDGDGDGDRARASRSRGRGQDAGPAPAPVPQKKADLRPEDFPALPSSTAAPREAKATWAAKPPAIADFPLASPVGKWDEEVAAMDASQSTS
ncbi:uncharacterized protein B0T15DRAFT_569193 [Chaetomium strumarium]|uniref:Uncharacterized protein n=1 Tax=Chaetomium strumarium TaxID=1170767 RepID=A0AAJ0GPD7_9PEZI|nr:hypothetical protein B0T15DRAFT_569193 [Chaetomium strumarium]